MADDKRYIFTEEGIRKAAGDVTLLGHRGKACAYCFQCPMCKPPDAADVAAILRQNAEKEPLP